MKTFDEIREARKEVKEKTLTLVLAGFGFVAALAWNDAIQSMFKFFFPESEGIIGKFIYALIVTFLAVVISSQLRKIAERNE